MKSCPGGAIVSCDELTVIVGGLEVAVDTINGYIDSETPRVRKATPSEQRSLAALKDSRREYQKILKRVDAAKKRCS